MLERTLIVFCLCFALVFGNLPFWPLPTSSSVGTTRLGISKGFAFKLAKNVEKNSLIQRAMTRIEQRLGAQLQSKFNVGTLIGSCELSIDDYTSELKVGTDESYTLSVDNDGSCSIHSHTVWGSLRAMETFTQLFIKESGVLHMNYAPVSVSDSSRFSHRGVLIDTARHYLPVENIKRIIDMLSMNKFNVLHWHTVDAESFPLDTPSAPTLVKGAYSPSSIYTMAVLADVQQYALDRGVRVVLEVDVPGHAASWNVGRPDIMADCLTKYTNVNNYALNPSLEDTYTTVGAVISDVLNATQASYIHLGGDEVVYGCWKNDASITSFMAAKGMTSYDQVLAYFVERVDAFATASHATPIHWEEVYTAGVPVASSTIFQVWTDSSKIAALTKSKYRVIASPSNYWYLDNSANTWKVMYGYDPTQGLSQAQADFIIGGEAAMWGEYVDQTNLESAIFPKAAAVAERLWSPATVTDLTDANQRLLIQRCRMVERGYNSAPVQPSFCSVEYV